MQGHQYFMKNASISTKVIHQSNILTVSTKHDWHLVHAAVSDGLIYKKTFSTEAICFPANFEIMPFPVSTRNPSCRSNRRKLPEIVR